VVFETLSALNTELVNCRRCPRLVAYREEVGRVRRRAYLDQEYWSRPVPGFGDPKARVVIVGLAPGAHGANRTGRMFTGDRSGEFLYRALHETGFANQPESRDLHDGLALSGAYITAPVRCVPPDNKPTRLEIGTCSSLFLAQELPFLTEKRVIVALGGIGFDTYLSLLKEQGLIRSRAAFVFGHNALYETHSGGPSLLASYHPSQQNTSTGKLTLDMLRAIFERARAIAWDD
jgi:uracil-DNA glycosylase family 4